MRDEMIESKIEKKVMQRGYRYCGSWIADDDDVWQGDRDRYYPSCDAGDLLVSLIGFDPGSVSWVENWGEIE